MRTLEKDLVDRRNGLPLRISRRSPLRAEKMRTVYQLAPVATNSLQKLLAANLGGMTTLPPERRGARKPARRPACRISLRVRNGSSRRTMDVEERHDEESPVGGRKGVRVDDVSHRRSEVEVRERDGCAGLALRLPSSASEQHTFRPARRAARVEHETNITLLRTPTSLNLSSSRPPSRKELDRDTPPVESDLGDLNAQLSRCHDGGMRRVRSSCTSRDEEELGLGVGEVEGDFGSVVGWVERGGDAAARGSQWGLPIAMNAPASLLFAPRRPETLP